MKRYASFDYDSSSECVEDTSEIKSSTQPIITATASKQHHSYASSCASNCQPMNKRARTYSNKIGSYIIGPKLNGLNYSSLITQYLCRKENSKEFFILKILNNNNSNNYDKTIQAKMLLHNEYALLTRLKDDDGVIHHHGLFKEINCINGELEKSEKLCLVLDCYLRHEFNNRNHFTNLQHFIIKEKFLNEREALTLFYKIFKVIEKMHKKNIVHRDLRLGNIIYDLHAQKVYLINFCLGCHLIDEKELLTGQFGSPAYISPEVLSDMPYYGKSNDVWSLGIVLFTMLFGHFPFYDPIPERLFEKIQQCEYSMPNNLRVSDNTKLLIVNILQIDPLKRLNASEVLDSIMSIFANHIWRSLSIDNRNVQLIPECSINNTNSNKQKYKQQQKKNFLYHSANIIDDETKYQHELILNLKNLSTDDNANSQLKNTANGNESGFIATNNASNKTNNSSSISNEQQSLKENIYESTFNYFSILEVDHV